MLLFKKKFLDAIRRGEKTQTIRLWKYRRFRAGQRSYIPGVGYIRVEAVDEVALDELSESDARPDGFADVRALRDELARLYAEHATEGLKAYRLRFRVFSQEDQRRMREEKQAQKKRSAEMDGGR